MHHKFFHKLELRNKSKNCSLAQVVDGHAMLIVFLRECYLLPLLPQHLDDSFICFFNGHFSARLGNLGTHPT